MNRALRSTLSMVLLVDLEERTVDECVERDPCSASIPV
jgi:hypothetical protein